MYEDIHAVHEIMYVNDVCDVILM